jgi:hypothetical protein
MSGSVGINTNSPETALHVSSNTPYIYFDDLSSTGTKKRTRFVNGDIGTCQSLTIGFSCLNGSSSIDLLTLNELGNIGLGTTTPNSGKVEIQTNGTSPALWVQTGGTTATYCLASFRTGTNAAAFEIYGNTNSYFGGSVGVGTQTPGDLLEVYGTTNKGINLCSNDQPRLGFFVGGASADHKIWDFIPQSNNTFIARAVNDAKNSATTWLSATRSGIAMTSICFPSSAPVYFGGCLGIGIVPNGPGLRLAQDTVLRIEGASSGEVSPDNFGISLGGRGSFRIDGPGVGAGRFVVNNAGCVGINQSSPIFKLQVSSGGAKTSGTQDPVLFLGTNESSNPWGVRVKPIGASAIANRYVEFQTTEVNIADGGNIVFQNGGGSVGIGTTSICGKFHVNAGGVTAGATQYGWPYYNAELDSQAKQIVFDAGGNGGVATAGTGPTMALILGTYYDSRAVITPFGAGSSSPGDQGQGRGKDLMIKGGTADNTNGYKGGRLFLNGGVGYSGNAYGTCVGDIIMQCMGSDGKVGIGAAPGSSGKLLVFDTGCTVDRGIPSFGSQAKGIEVYNACSGNTDNVIGYWISTGPHKVGIASGRTNAASTWEVDLRFYTHPTTIGSLDATCENMRLYGDGSLVTRGGASSPGLYSDVNLKENLSIIPSALNKIKCINGYTFDWKDNAPARSNPSLLNIVHDAGLIAQEVESILPDIVRDNDLSCIKMLNYNGVIALLVEGMKEQQCTIDTLKSCIGIS